MSSPLEFEANNLEKAVQKACKECGLEKEQLDYEVISYGSSGIFGLVGTKKAKIRVHMNRQALQPETVSSTSSTTDHDVKPDISALVSADSEESPSQSPTDRDAYDFSTDSEKLGEDVLQRLIDFITTDAEISTMKNNDQEITYNVSGGEAAVLIGRRGQTLEAIQYLVEKIVNKHNGRRMRVQVDVEGYLKKREVVLQELAVRLAEKSIRTGKPATVGQMNANDRRIVHLALKDNHHVRTQSIGNGFIRKLVIFPKKAHRKRHKE